MSPCPFLVLEAAGKKACPKDARDHLDAGAVYPCDLVVTGTIDEETIDPLSICGTLNVGHDGTFKRQSKPAALAIAAALLPFIPRTRRAAAVQDIVSAWVASGEAPVDRSLPEPDAAIAQLAADLVGKLSFETVAPKSGAVAFEFGV